MNVKYCPVSPLHSLSVSFLSMFTLALPVSDYWNSIYTNIARLGALECYTASPDDESCRFAGFLDSLPGCLVPTAIQTTEQAKMGRTPCILP